MIAYTKLFYNLVGPKLLILLVVMQAAAIVEGFGISLILPIIQGDSQSDSRLASVINWGFDLIKIDPNLTNTLIVLVIFFIVRGGLLIGQSWYQSQILSRNLTNMRVGFATSIANAEFSYVNKQDSGVLSNVMSVEIERVNHALSQLLSLMIAATTALVYIGIALLVAPVVTIFLAILIAPIAVIMIYLNRLTSRASLELTAGSNKQQSIFLEMLRNMKYLKATGRSIPVLGRVVKESQRVGTAYRKLTFLQGATAYGLEPFIVLVLAGVIYFFTEIRGGDVLEILFLLFVFRSAAVNLVATQPAYRKFLSADGSMRIYRDLRTNLEANRELGSSANLTPDFTSGISIENVSYTYEGQTAPSVDNVSLTIPAKSTVAFVGPSGSGKSTTANILASLLQPTAGDVRMGGSSYQDINIDNVRENVGYVTQESVVFNASLEENILLWQDSKVDKSRLDEVIAKTGLDKIQRSHSANTELGESGTSLSGGERQRLSIARELYWESELLILDEATSSVDSMLEKQIDDVISSQRGTKTIIVIAHRLSTVRDADVIFVFENGKIAESGSFDELVAAGGLFSDMAKLQSF
ncbi:ABC transporter ATP-binding protein [Candidatus Lucifugimonas marina]|uniref:ATP-binding cassette domain-containing protein n=1 Tax=Candidatus Lucifugimonas marina TaxID=3038979 RepID=A0AAJ5ZIM0_9CHLR|nr:ATP-binding cassette domain-containing protein [SAR202 cluster bacterium JH702]MDG0868228.1 ATP-binding cassette domain-containing protein [SAR202 cluster bacterium JH639]WFG34872.1 ATP-binding cassette domain-containing protein [SAR202 cluster bacterium JH545]WFG38823.1 ATP-binding cassette domain-containing protein [SAR202 cluster bacterium JH1073]